MKSVQPQLFSDLKYKDIRKVLATPPAQSSGAFGSQEKSDVGRLPSAGACGIEGGGPRRSQSGENRVCACGGNLSGTAKNPGDSCEQPSTGGGGHSARVGIVAEGEGFCGGGIPASDAQRLSDQCKTVLAWLKAGGEVTPARAREIGCQRLAARIGEIKAMGYAITSRRDPVTKEAVYAMEVKP